MIQVTQSAVNIESNDIVRDLYMLFETLTNHGFDLDKFIVDYKKGILGHIYSQQNIIPVDVPKGYVRAMAFKNEIKFM